MTAPLLERMAKAARSLVAALDDPFTLEVDPAHEALRRALSEFDALPSRSEGQGAAALSLDLLEHARSLMLDEAHACLRLLGWITALDEAIRLARRRPPPQPAEGDGTAERCKDCGQDLAFARRLHAFRPGLANNPEGWAPPWKPTCPTCGFELRAPPSPPAPAQRCTNPAHPCCDEAGAGGCRHEPWRDEPPAPAQAKEKP